MRLKQILTYLRDCQDSVSKRQIERYSRRLMCDHGEQKVADRLSSVALDERGKRAEKRAPLERPLKHLKKGFKEVWKSSFHVCTIPAGKSGPFHTPASLSSGQCIWPLHLVRFVCLQLCLPPASPFSVVSKCDVARLNGSSETLS